MLIVNDLKHMKHAAAPRYGLVNNKPCLERLEPPPGSGGVSQAAATPRYILAVTQGGQCWTHEEGKVGTSTVQYSTVQYSTVQFTGGAVLDTRGGQGGHQSTSDTDEHDDGHVAWVQ